MLTIRKFKAGDEPAIQALISSIMNREFPQSEAAYPSQDLADIPRTYGNKGEAFFVAMNHDHIVGTVAVKREDERMALLRRIFVEPAFRNQRIGMKLLAQAIDFCKENGYEEIIFKTSTKMDKAIRLCQQNGFHPRTKLEAGGLELLKLVLHLGREKG